jgi:hypothetical protein
VATAADTKSFLLRRSIFNKHGRKCVRLPAAGSANWIRANSLQLHHTQKSEIVFLFLYFKHTHTHTGGLSAAKKKSRRATGMFFYFYFLCTARCSRYWRFSSSFFLSSTQSGAAAFFSLFPSSINCQLSSITPASLTDQMKLLEARGKLISASRPRTRTSSPSLPVAAD